MNKIILALALLLSFLPSKMKSECHFIVDYLYWNAREDQLPFAFDLHPGNSPFLVESFSRVDQKFNWDSGVRVGGNFLSPCSCWEVDLLWTLFRTNSFSKVEGPAVGAFFMFGFLSDLQATYAQSRWDLHCNTLLLNTSCSFELQCPLTISPHAGILGALIQQKQQVEYGGLTDNLGDPLSVHVRRKNEYWGVGPAAGVDFEWLLYDNCSLVGRVDGAILFGRFEVKNTYHFFKPTFDSSSKIDEKLYRGRPMLDAYLGFGWDICVLGNQTTFSLGYELEYWWQQWHAPANLLDQEMSSGGGRWGDLMFNGFTLSVLINF